MANAYQRREDIEKLAKEILEQHHDDVASFMEHSHVPILVLGIRDQKKVKGKGVWADIQIWQGEAAYLSRFLYFSTEADDEFADQLLVEPGPVVVIRVHELTWDLLGQDEDGLMARKALIDHELCHLSLGINSQNNVSLKLRGHDVEDFIDIMKRYGTWTPHIKKFVEAAKAGNQLELHIDVDEINQEASGGDAA